MALKQWLLIAPAALVIGFGGRALLNPALSRSSDGRLMDAQSFALEAKTGHHLYAPTWLPYGGRIGTLGAMQGAKRILQDFGDKFDRSLCILSQERRTEERDRYHARIFAERAESEADINGKTGYFVIGESGERRLHWNETDSAVILSSSVLTDGEMLQVARKVR